MQGAVDFLKLHWMALIPLVAATILLALGLRRKTGMSTRRVAIAIYLLLMPSLGAWLGASTLEIQDNRFSVAELAIILSAIGFLTAGTVLVFLRVWSYRLGLVLGAILCFGLGGFLAVSQAGMIEKLRLIPGLEFVHPEWLFLLAFIPFVFRIARKSLSGLGPTRKWIAICTRALIVALLAMAIAEPRIRRNSENVTVLFVVDRSFSIPQDIDPDKPPSEALDRRWERLRKFMEQSVEKRGAKHREDRSGVIMFGKRPKLLLPPAAVQRMPIDERAAGPINGDYTDIAAALKLAYASFPEGTGKRIVLLSDGNENIGSAEEQAAIARETGIQIDTIALAPGYRNDNDILVQSVEVPQVATQGQRLPVRVQIRNTTRDKAVICRLYVTKVSNSETGRIEIEDGPMVLENSDPPKVRVLPGLNVFRFRDRVNPQGDSSCEYKVSIKPIESQPLDGGQVVQGLPGDRTANNQASAALVSRGTRRVLFLDDSTGVRPLHQHLIDTLKHAKIRVDWLPADKLPADKGELGIWLSDFDCVIIANVPAEKFTTDQMEMIRTSVYEQGCGLIMIGGGEAFGAGGYQGTPVEAALPVDCEIKALKAAGKGGLVLIMHACEIADGNKWEKDIAKLAVKRLGPNDMVGVLEYGQGPGGAHWAVPFQEVGESQSESRSKIMTEIDRMTPGDMPDFDPHLRAAVDTLSDSQYHLTVKHCILISDGDPQYGPKGQTAVADMVKNGVTCTTIGVATHGGAEKTKLREIAESTRDGEGKKGTFYDVDDPRKLPAIYIKESRRVCQSFIVNDKIQPRILESGLSDVLAPDLPRPLPQLHGYVRTTLKENKLASMSLEAPSPYPDQRFPVLASWRYGLGKAVAFTSDARTQPGNVKRWWDQEWVESEMYRKFWEQAVNWTMREPEKGKLAMTTEYRDGRVRVMVDVRDEKDKPVIGLDIRGAVTTPSPPGPGEKAPKVEFKPKGGGQYEAEFPAEEAGSYFLNVQAIEPERDAKGNIVRFADGTARSKVFDGGRAGVTVPYSPEFSDLESNTPLMKRLSEMTGGEFHTEADEELRGMLEAGSIFRESPKTTRALLPFWFLLVFIAAMLLILDVGIRRVSLEADELTRGFNKFWTALRRRAEFEDESASLGRLLQRKAAVSAAIDRGRASRRFEPEPDAPFDPAPTGADDYAAAAPERTDQQAPSRTQENQAPPEEEEDTFAKLQKAKKRAKHRQNRPDEERPE